MFQPAFSGVGFLFMPLFSSVRRSTFHKTWNFPRDALSVGRAIRIDAERIKFKPLQPESEDPAVSSQLPEQMNCSVLFTHLFFRSCTLTICLRWFDQRSTGSPERLASTDMCCVGQSGYISGHNFRPIYSQKLIERNPATRGDDSTGTWGFGLNWVPVKHNHRARLGPVVISAKRLRFRPLQDVVRGVESGINPAAPRIFGCVIQSRQLKIERLPVGIQNHVKE